MRNLRYMNGPWYTDALQPLLKVSHELIESGETDPAIILEKSRTVAAADPLALEFWGDADGLRSDVQAHLAEYKAKIRQAQESEARKAAASAPTNGSGATRRETTPAETAKQEEEPEGTDLLPFPGFKGYALDPWGIPHGLGGQGRKAGPLRPIRRWKPRKDGQKARFIFGYRLSLDGTRVFRSALSCAIARTNAERSEWENSL